MSVRRSIIAAGTAGAITLGALAAVPAFAQDQPAGPDTEQGPSTEERKHLRQERQELMAAQLGITVEELRAAVRAAHEAVVAELGPVDPENPPDAETAAARHDAFRAALAAELGISAEELHAAALAVFEQQVQAAVEAGFMTQEEADEAIAAFEDGTLREYLRAEGLERLANRLEQAVAEGLLSQEDADEILAAAEAGTLREQIESGEIVLPEGWQPGHRPHRPGGLFGRPGGALRD